MRGAARWLLVLVWVLGCGGGQTRGNPLESSWDDQKGEELAEFVASWERPAPRPEPAVVLGVVDATHIVGYAYDRKQRWERHYPFESRPVLAGEVVVGMGEGFVFALDSVTGEQLWQRKALGWLRGVGDDGRTTVISIEGMSGERSTVLAIDRSGNVVRQFFETAVVGSPAVFDEFAFLPYGQGLVVIFDLIRGTEVARVVSQHPITRAFIVDDELYFGEQLALRFDDRIVAARHGGGSRFEPPERRFPGEPRWLLPGDLALPMHTTRSDSLRIHQRPGGPAVLSSYRLAIGLGDEGRTRWVYTGDDIFVGGSAGRKTVALCDAAGRAIWLDLDSGSELARADVGEPLASCQLQNRGPPKLTPKPLPPLEDQLHQALAQVDALNLPIQLVLLDDLAAIEGARATAQIIQLARRGPLSFAAAKALRERAAELLARRSTGHAPIVDALRAWSGQWQPYDAPVAALADAARRNHLAEAAASLARGLHHPFAGAEDLAAVARALEALADEEQRDALRLFVVRYRCAQSPPLRRAVEHVGRALRRLGADGVLQKAADACDPARTRPPSGDASPPPTGADKTP